MLQLFIDSLSEMCEASGLAVFVVFCWKDGPNRKIVNWIALVSKLPGDEDCYQLLNGKIEKLN